MFEFGQQFAVECGPVSDRPTYNDLESENQALKAQIAAAKTKAKGKPAKKATKRK